MKIRLSKDEIKAIVLSSLQSSMPNISDKDITMDNEGIAINTTLADALGVTFNTSAPRTRRRSKSILEGVTREDIEKAVTEFDDPSIKEMEEENKAEEAASNNEPELTEDNSVTGILEGSKDPKGLFD
jgi:hypothetical protein